MNLDGDDDFQEEEVPERLRKRWEAEEEEDLRFEKKFIDCPFCGKKIESKSFSCLYCGEQVFKDSGFLGKMVKHKNKMGWLFAFLVLLTAVALGLIY